MSTERSGKQWHAFLVEDLPPYIQEQVRALDPEAATVRWKELDARWCTYSGLLPEDVSSAVLGFVIRLRRAEPHLCFVNGHVFYYLDPESSYCQLADLEKNLEGQNRYAGNVRWTVGQHWRFCVEITRIHQRDWKRFAGYSADEEVPPLSTGSDLALQVVKYHDHAEGAVQDINVGLKRALRQVRGCPPFLPLDVSDFDAVEALADTWVRRRIFPKVVSEALHKFSKWVDMRAAWIEMQQLGFPDYFVEETAEGQVPVLPEEVEAFRKIQGESRTVSGSDWAEIQTILVEWRDDQLQRAQGGFRRNPIPERVREKVERVEALISKEDS